MADSVNQAGYKTLYLASPPTVLLSPFRVGEDLAGGDRGATLRQSQTPTPTAGLQANNALTANGVAGYGATLPKASPPLVLTFVNTDVVAMSIWPLPGVLPHMPADDQVGHFPDTINGSTGPFVLAAGEAITLTAPSRTGWTTS